MQAVETGILYSATDIVNFLACQHLVGLERDLLDGVLDRPDDGDPSVELVREKGIEHEKAILARFYAEGKRVVEVPTEGASIAARVEATRAALSEGPDIIYQAAFREDPWFGIADFLLRVEEPSELGTWRYEVADTKLARHVKPKHVIQLCFYADLLGRIQGAAPRQLHVVLGDQRYETLRADDYMAYFRRVRDRFLEHVRGPRRATYPEPVEHCGVCRWAPKCEQRRLDDDHLSLVAWLRADQAVKLRRAGIRTVAALAGANPDQRPSDLSPTTYASLQQQARLQTHQRQTGEPRFELLPYVAGRGLALLPRPSDGDVFFDMEGDPYQEGGLEYLFGAVFCEGGQMRFVAFWGHDRAGEKRAFEDFIDLVVERRRRYPDMHVYHYAPYEETAIKRLASLHGTREQEVDDLLRGQVLVDLYRVVRQGLRISQPSYSIKKLEVFYMKGREAEVKDAGASIVAYERFLKLGDPAILEEIRRYNEEDCRSTAALRDWLLERRADLESRIGEPIPWREAPEDDRQEQREAIQAEIDGVKTRLCEGLPDDPDEDDPTQSGFRLMADLLDYHRREAKPNWWAFFNRCTFDQDELIADPDCLGGLVPVGSGPVRMERRSAVWAFGFPPQEHKFRPRADALDPATGRPAGQILVLDDERATLELKRGPSLASIPLPAGLIPGTPLKTDAQKGALRRLADEVAATGSHGARFAALRDILFLRPPRLVDRAQGSPLQDEAQAVSVEDARRLCTALDDSYLVVQGPPGSGKTYMGGRLIATLLSRGKKVGVAALSHKAIHKLLEEVEDVILSGEVPVGPFRGLKKSSPDHPDSEFPSRTGFIGTSAENAAFADPSIDLMAGTAWLFSRPELEGRLDYLFIDEAGQISLADALAMGTAARNLVLLGDPQQLPQVSQGVHPGRSGASVLEHLLMGHSTVPVDRGLFLSETRRLHPAIAAFVSEISYEHRLKSAEGCEFQVIESPGLSGAGLRFLPVEHEGNSQASIEEAERIRDEIARMVGGTYRTRDGRVQPLRYEDILVVAPYNLQVNLLRDTLPPAVRVGTVDKFQGQEAPVVFFSMATSSGAEMPRDIGFLFSRNRLNVAISRAKCLAVIVMSPDLLDIECRRVNEIPLVNGLCRFVELAREEGQCTGGRHRPPSARP